MTDTFGIGFPEANLKNIRQFYLIFPAFDTQFISIHTTKNSPFGELIGWDGRIRTSEMPGPKPGALPLGDVPLSLTSIILLRAYLKVKQNFKILVYF